MLKAPVFIVVTVLFYQIVLGQAKITHPAFSIKIQDFGAIPNDGKDDTWAFIKAAKYFNNLWDINGTPLPSGKQNFNANQFSGRLEIPSGKYLVGKQVNIPATGLNSSYGELFNSAYPSAPIRFKAGGAYKAGLEVMSIRNINQLLIIGIGPTPPQIVYNNGLEIGYFNNTGQPLWFPATTHDPKYSVSVGSFLEATNCSNIAIENIEIDGNNIPTTSGGNTTYNGGWALDLIQLGATGTYFLNTKNVSLTKLNIHHMTLDGILFQDFYKDTLQYPKQPYSNLSINSVSCNYNRRQGFSWVGGRKVTVTNSSFNYTGTTVTGIASGNPGAGVDIEPEADGSELLLCVDGSFTNCNFIDNKGCAVVNDLTATRSKNVLFTNCKFHDVDGFSVWVKGRSFVFKKCKIWGGFVYGNDGEVKGENTQFYDCDFADEEMPSKKGLYNADFALVESSQFAKKLLFVNCTFRTLHQKQRLVSIFSNAKAEEDFTMFKNCRFTAKQGHENNLLFGTVFDGNNSIMNEGTIPAIFLINGLIIKGSNDAKKPNQFLVDGNCMVNAANTNGPQHRQFILGRSAAGSSNEGHLGFTIGTQSCVFGYWDQTIDIGKNTLFTNKGQLAMLNGNINLSGQLNLASGSYTAFFNPVNFNNNSINTGVITCQQGSNFDVKDSWKKNLEGMGKPQPINQMKFSEKVKVNKK